MRQHPIAFFRYTYRKFWLLAIPFVRALTHTENRENILKSSLYIDIIILVIILFFAVVRWYNSQIYLKENGIIIKNGVLIKRESFIPFSSVSMVKTGEMFLIKPFNAILVCIYTDAESGYERRSESNQKFLFKLTDYKQIFKKLPCAVSDKKRVYRLSRKNLALYSLAFSSVLSGVVYIFAMLVQSGNIVKNELEKVFVTAVNDVTQIAEKVIDDITPFEAAVVVVIVISWILSFFLNYLRNIDFVSVRSKKRLMTIKGYFYREKNYVDVRKICFIDIRQKLLMKIFGAAQVNTVCSENMPRLIPFCRKRNIPGFIKILIPEMSRVEDMIFFEKKQLMRYMAAPIIMLYGVIVTGAAAVIFFPDWYRLIFFSAVISEILILHFYAMRIIDYFTGSAVFGENSVVIKYSRFLCFHHVIIPKDRIAEIKITSNILQRISSSCDVSFYSAGRKSFRHTIKGVKIYDAEKITGQIFKENFYE